MYIVHGCQVAIVAGAISQPEMIVLRIRHEPVVVRSSTHSLQQERVAHT